jgi:hypothetical protein
MHSLTLKMESHIEKTEKLSSCLEEYNITIPHVVPHNHRHNDHRHGFAVMKKLECEGKSLVYIYSIKSQLDYCNFQSIGSKKNYQTKVQIFRRNFNAYIQGWEISTVSTVSYSSYSSYT